MKIFSPVVRAVTMIVAMAVIILCALLLFGVLTDKWVLPACSFGGAVLMIMLTIETKKKSS